MSEKRKRDSTGGDRGQQKKRKGFTVGPANLPDGTYKRKTQQIKNTLIERAQIKKQYAKVKRQTATADEATRLPVPASAQSGYQDNVDPGAISDTDGLTGNVDQPPEPSTTPHPDRVTLMDQPDRPTDKDNDRAAPRQSRPVRGQRPPRPSAFSREARQAQERKEEIEARRKALEEAQRQRQDKAAERERFRRAMAKARTGGPNGQRKLGRESKVLLERVRRMTGNGGG